MKKRTKLLERWLSKDDMRSLQVGWNLALQIICGIIVGIGLGWLVDWQFHTKPWGILAGCILGFVAGLRNCYQDFKKSGKSE